MTQSSLGEPEDMGHAFELILERRLLDVHTAMPGKIVRWDPVEQVADVEPALSVEVPDEDDPETTRFVRLPILPSVPVIFPRSRTAYITFPIGVGDHVLLVFQERDHTEWRQTGRVSDPPDVAVHDPSHAVALVGYYPAADTADEVDGDAVVIGHNGAHKVFIDDGATRHGSKTADKALALAEAVEENLQRIVDAISGAGTGSSDGGAAFKAAIVTALNTPPVVPISVGSSKVFSDD